MTRIDLPGGGWADLADPAQVTHRKRRPVRRLMFELVGRRATDPSPGPSAEELDLYEELSDALVVAMVTAWSYPGPITAEALEDLPGAVYDALQVACAPYSKDLLPSFEVSPDPKAAPTTTASSPSSPTLSVVDSISPTNMPAPTS